jgi:hypothetical protein
MPFLAPFGLKSASEFKGLSNLANSIPTPIPTLGFDVRPRIAAHVSGRIMSPPLFGESPTLSLANGACSPPLQPQRARGSLIDDPTRLNRPPGAWVEFSGRLQNENQHNYSVCSGIAGCASHADDIAAEYVSPVQYQSYTCAQLQEEAARVSARAATASGAQNQKANNDAIATALALCCFGRRRFS